VNPIFASILTSAGLGAGAGLNAYATMLVFGLLARLRPEVFKGELAHFFASTPVLTIVGVLYVVEFVADKVPTVDHAWDVIHTLIRPAAGALVAWAAATKGGGLPHGAVIMASVIAGTAALGMHGAKATTRAASTIMTGGLANPLLSLAEDLFAFAGALAALFLPLMVLVILLLILLFFVVVARRRGVPA
jgi:hypothetical protein